MYPHRSTKGDLELIHTSGFLFPSVQGVLWYPYSNNQYSKSQNGGSSPILSRANPINLMVFKLLVRSRGLRSAMGINSKCSKSVQHTHHIEWWWVQQPQPTLRTICTEAFGILGVWNRLVLCGLVPPVRCRLCHGGGGNTTTGLSLLRCVQWYRSSSSLLHVSWVVLSRWYVHSMLWCSSGNIWEDGAWVSLTPSCK